MKLNTLFFTAALAGFMTLGSGCNGDKPVFIPGDGPTLGGEDIPTDALLSLTVSKKNSLLSGHTWSDGNTLGLFLTKGSPDRPYRSDGSATNVRAVMKAGLWTFPDGDVTLDDTPAVLFAYTPHRNGADPYSLPVETASGTQYMYGTHLSPQVSVREGEPMASLEMRHILSLVELRIRKHGNFRERALLQQVAIEAASDSTLLPVKGTVDIVTGALTETAYGSYGLSDMRRVLPVSYEDSCIWRLTTIPRDLAEGEVNLTLTVNGLRMSLPVPEENDWRAGQRSIYNIVVDADVARVEKVEIVPWRDIIIEGEFEDRNGYEE